MRWRLKYALCSFLVLLQVALYIVFMEVCRVNMVTFDRRFESLPWTVAYHWLAGPSQTEVEQFHGETMLAAKRLLEALNITYWLGGGATISVARGDLVGQAARMIPWDEDADFHTLGEDTRSKLLAARSDGSLARLLDLEKFELQLDLSPSTLLVFAGILVHKFSGRRAEFYRFSVLGEHEPKVDACALREVNLVPTTADGHSLPGCASLSWEQEAAGIATLDDVARARLCKARCVAVGSCRYWHLTGDTCLACEESSWRTRMEGYTTMVAGPSFCPQGGPTMDDAFAGVMLHSFFTVAFRHCVNCLPMPKSLQSDDAPRKSFVLPRNWILPSQPCPARFWYPGAAEPFMLRCPARMDKFLEYTFDTTWRTPTGMKLLCGASKESLEASLLVPSFLATAALSVVCWLGLPRKAMRSEQALRFTRHRDGKGREGRQVVLP